MTRNYLLILILALCFISKSNSQNIYSEKLDGCNTEHFALESDSTTAKIDNKKIINLITKNLKPKILKEINGDLKIQIIAYNDKS